MYLSSEWFKEWFNSPYYHQLYFERDEKEAAQLISHLLGKLQLKPGSRLIDVGCGRGRHARILAGKGFDVTGIDIAPDSIAFAKQFEQEQLHFYLHDMRRPCWINYFDCAFNFFTSFGFFKTKREHHDAIRTIAQSLQRDGLFVLDYINTVYTEAHLIPDTQKKVGDTVFYLTKWADETHFFKRIRIEDPAVPSPLTYTERIEKFTLNDFTDMFALHGLRVKDVYGDYSLNAYDEDQSPRLLIIASRDEMI
ncbi:MAG TPA: methyltransferase domain-containing protein [Puia sp.]|nr:methyltransferase domain-containing protein [Puia sp.]